MNVTKNVIADLFPLYVENVCSPDTRVLVDEYLRSHPQDAEELRQIMSNPMPKAGPPAKGLDEMDSLRTARRLIRRRSWLLGLAIFFSIAPFSVLYTGGKAYWLFLESPKSAAVYATLAVASWIAYAITRNRSQSL